MRARENIGLTECGGATDGSKALASVILRPCSPFERCQFERCRSQGFQRAFLTTRSMSVYLLYIIFSWNVRVLLQRYQRSTTIEWLFIPCFAKCWRWCILSSFGSMSSHLFRGRIDLVHKHLPNCARNQPPPVFRNDVGKSCRLKALGLQIAIPK